MSRILIVDDDRFFRKVITKLLDKHGYDITSAGSGEEALEILESQAFDLMVSDINMTPMDGMELLERSREAYGGMGVIMLTGHDEIEVAVEAMKKGAFDFLVKPFQMDELFATVQRSLKYYHISPDSNLLEKKMSQLEGLIMESAVMRRVGDMMKRIAPANVAVLLRGEKGSDSELIARTLHYYSPRKDESFVAFNCAASSSAEIATELFGAPANNTSLREEGLFEAAKGGTLFLDNIHTMSLKVQAELLDAIQTEKIKGGNGEVKLDVRLVVASSEKLDLLVGDGAFHENLYYRLSALSIDIPPLCCRSEDIPLLIDRAVRRNVESERDVPVIRPEAQNILYSYAWPGNEMELEAAVQRMLLLAENGAITPETLPMEIVEGVVSGKTVVKETEVKEQYKGLSFKAFLHSKHENLFSGSDGSSEEE